ncbi:hypothetical protein Poli38472_006596 [Pythium oligandrum]|uniref:ABC transporter domain-containing protein n=1 Tax=Pythium oligandrum TaxID=41045 RepID=A0A8K1C4V6_PYTOL|nr:hypothetical protein Poli38472_006596 [Pythium oligandrum]|eukprot:TMW56586.1 hypothetical protein Poli38472_006596 [Pythium oligandrum]
MVPWTEGVLKLLGSAQLGMRALLRKNALVKARHALATLSELLNPLLCILLFAALKTLEPDMDIPSGWATETANKTHTESDVGSAWTLYATNNLLGDVNATLAGLGREGLPNATTGFNLSSITASPMGLLALTSGLDLPRFYFTETTMPGLLLNLGLQSLLEGERLDTLEPSDLFMCFLLLGLGGYTSLDPTSLYAVPRFCGDRVVPYKIAITPDTEYTRKYFTAIMDAWYPRTPLVAPVLGISPLTTASFLDSRVFFQNETALEDYLSSEEYGLDLDHPKIYAAIAFQEFPEEKEAIGDAGGHSIEFSLRFNSTFTDTNFPNSVPRTIKRRTRANALVKSVRSQAAMTYATRGFMTLQTAVMRVLNCLPAWDAQTETVMNPNACQLQKARMQPDPEHDKRLLRQLDDDMIIGSILQLMTTLRDQVSDVTSTSTPPVLKAYLSAILSLSVSVDDIPAKSKEQLLMVLRTAPQAFHGAAAFMSPVQGYHYAGFYTKVLVVFPVGFILSYLYGVSRVIVALLMEKETRSREFMRILGLQERQIIFAWFLTYVQLFLVATLLQTIGASSLLFPNSSRLLLFLFFFTFALSSFGYGFLISTLFNRARAGSFVGMGVFFMMFFVSFSFKEGTSEHMRTLSCLLSPVAFAQGINILARVESVGIGLDSSNASEPIEGIRFIATIVMQFVAFLFYVLLGSYFEKVMPKEYGVPEKWYFPLIPSYWRQALCPSRRHSDRDRVGSTPNTAMDEESLSLREGEEVRIGEHERMDTMEPVGSDLKKQELDGRAVVITNLRKEFDVPGGKKVAVKGLHLKMYEGQITCLLGHNGAGKTTLMSMLTGMTPPTSGEAFVRGLSIRTDMDRIRESLGYCPQFSVVYPELTVEEHLRFYGQVKGLKDPELTEEVSKKISEVGLTEKRRVQAHALSGGMKRKLSLAISFLGESRVVFLDEPTSGMDPYSRRSTWDLIQSNRKNRVLILTTHFMDEADLLGDRIAILAEGELRCVGSSLFLKNRYGVGYRLSLVLGQRTQHSSQTRSDGVFMDLVQRHVPQARVATDIGTELTFQLPFESSSTFPRLFEELEARQDELGVASFAISITTLEEIFLKVAENRVIDSGDVKAKKDGGIIVPERESVDPIASQGSREHSRIAWFLIQMRALLLKRLLSAKRDKRMLFYSMLLPIVILIAGLSALKLSLFIRNDPAVPLTFTDQFVLAEKTPVPFACVDADGNSDSSWCLSMLQSSNGFLTGGESSRVLVESTVYDGATTPTVFGIPYDSPAIEPTDTSGYCLRFSELAFEQAYGVDSRTNQPINQTPVLGQLGGFVVEASASSYILSYNVMVNSSSTHAAPIYKAQMDEAIHRFLLADGASTIPDKQKDIRIRMSTHPFPLTFKTRSIFGSFLSLPAVIFVLIAFTFVPASMMPFLVKEKSSEQNSRHQQLLSGVSLTAYWLANFIFDMLIYLVPMTSAILLLQFYSVSSSLSRGASESKSCTGCTRDVPQAVLALFFLFGTSIAPLTYLLSHLMRDPGACLLYIVMLNFAIGLVLLLASYSMDSLDSTREANAVLVYLWRCSPLFSLANGLLSVIITDIEALYGFSTEPRSAFSKEIAGYEITYLAIEGPVFFLLALLVDFVKTGEWTIGGQEVRVLMSGVWKWCRSRVYSMRRSDAKLHVQETMNGSAEEDTREQDEDVRAEANRVLTSLVGDAGASVNAADDEVVRIFRLQKTYADGKCALSNLTFGLQRGECFGFLGINGAGKTTTMKILTGDLLPTYGTAQLNGHDILLERAKVRQNVGYCPQFDALLELLTVQEHLEFYGRLKGFVGKQLHQQVNRLLVQFQLTPFKKKLAGSLSGGNKRKLSVAIAMIGDPVLLFLDEPSTGMDPFSRRFMWDIILQVSVQSRRSTIMLTTHSMEECEALCNRAGIMVGGKLKCFGTIPHLKTRFGEGFLLESKLETPSDDVVEVILNDLRVQSKFPDDGMISKADIQDVCSVLGKPERASWILTPEQHHPTGSLLLEQLQRSDGGLDIREFSSWWILEDRVEKLTEFLKKEFGEFGVSLVERQMDYCRFKLVPSQSSPDEGPPRPFALSHLFRVFEDGRVALAVKEYSISQTSLEQIFNAFARQQHEEQGVSKAFWTPGG